jgi:maleamate amidohydrolase
LTEDLKDSYSLYNGSLGYGERSALILVDFVQAYFDKDCEMYAGVEDELASALRIRDLARDAGIKVLYSNVVYQQDGSDGGVFFTKAPVLKNFIAGNPMGNWPKGLQPADNEMVISKQYPSAFFGTTLASVLNEEGVDTLLITGLTTSGCVRATCVDAMCNGFIPIVVADACGDRHAAPHEANLFDMNAKYADVVSEIQVCDYLRSLVEEH